MLAVGRLDGVSTLLPDKSLFLNAYVRKEAVLSSQIEGTQSSLSDLLLFELDEAPGVPLDDVVEVSNCVAALEHGLDRLREGFPLSNRLIREAASSCTTGTSAFSPKARRRHEPSKRQLGPLGTDQRSKKPPNARPSRPQSAPRGENRSPFGAFRKHQPREGRFQRGFSWSE